MKRFLVLLLVIIMAAGCFSSCKKYDDETQAPPTNEELISERIETFLTAYNTGDMDAVLECLDAKTRNAFQAMLNLLGGLAGGVTGVDIDLSDLFSLGVNTTQGDFMELEITDITVTNSSNAIATTAMDLPGAGTQTIYFEMVYENDGWYIHDMTDRKPIIMNDNQSGNSNSGNSTNANDNTSNDTNDTNDTNDINDTIAGIIHEYPFVDGRAWVNYRDIAFIEYYGFIDMQGNVIYSIPASGVEIYNIGKGSAIVSSEDELILIDKNGETKMKLDGTAVVKLYGNGFAWIYQNKSSISSLEHLYGVVNHAGEWIEPLQNLEEEGLYDRIEYIGDGFVSGEWEHFVLPIWNADKSVQITLDGIYSNCSITFENGMAFVSQSIYKYEEAAWITVTKNKGENAETSNTYVVNNDCVIFADGRVVDLGEWITELNYNPTFYNGKVITDRKIQLEVGQYFEITDYTKSTPITVEFTAYPASQIENFVFNGDYGLVQIRGLDKETYITMIDAQGHELITPIKTTNPYDFELAPNGYLHYRKGDLYYIVDKNNNTTETNIIMRNGLTVEFYTGSEIGKLQVADGYSYKSYYIKPDGEILFEKITLN